MHPELQEQILRVDKGGSEGPWQWRKREAPLGGVENTLPPASWFCPRGALHLRVWGIARKLWGHLAQLWLRGFPGCGTYRFKMGRVPENFMHPPLFCKSPFVHDKHRPLLCPVYRWGCGQPPLCRNALSHGKSGHGVLRGWLLQLKYFPLSLHALVLSYMQITYYICKSHSLQYCKLRISICLRG